MKTKDIDTNGKKLTKTWDFLRMNWNQLRLDVKGTSNSPKNMCHVFFLMNSTNRLTIFSCSFFFLTIRHTKRAGYWSGFMWASCWTVLDGF